MLFRTRDLDALRRGTLTLAFRRLRRPPAREGGALRTPVGEVPIVSLRPVEPEAIPEADARRAGFASRDDLLATLSTRPDGVVYRIELGPVRPDPEAPLPASPPPAGALDALRETLDRIDDRAPDGAWTRRVLEVLHARPGARAGELCGLVGMAGAPFGRRVRALEGLGLTERLEAGHRLSPLGAALRTARDPDAAPDR